MPPIGKAALPQYGKVALPLVDARSIALSITTAAPGADGVDLPHWELALRAIMESQQNQSDSEGLP